MYILEKTTQDKQDENNGYKIFYVKTQTGEKTTGANDDIKSTI